MIEISYSPNPQLLHAINNRIANNCTRNPFILYMMDGLLFFSGEPLNGGPGTMSVNRTDTACSTSTTPMD